MICPVFEQSVCVKWDMHFVNAIIYTVFFMYFPGMKEMVSTTCVPGTVLVVLITIMGNEC